MRFRPLTKPLHAPRRARVVAALSLMVLAAAIALVGSGVITLQGALFSLALSAGLGVLAVGLAVFGLSHIWNHGGKGVRDCSLALLWALPVIAAVAGLTYVVTQTPSYPDLATNFNSPPQFEVLAQNGPDAPLPLDAASPAERIRISLENPDLTAAYIERPGWHVAEVLETFLDTSGYELVRLDTQDGLSFSAEFPVPGSLPLATHDIAMRIVDDGFGSTIDARSFSSIPLHDFGTNAPVLEGLIQRFLLALEATPPPTSDL